MSMFLNKTKEIAANLSGNTIQNSQVDRRSNSILNTNIPSIIAPDSSILGNIISEGALEVEGNVEGNISCHFVCIRKQGFVKGDVVANEVNIDGEVRGLVKAKVVKLSSSAKVIGIIMYESLAIDAGAFVDGQFKSAEKISINEDFNNCNITDVEPDGVVKKSKKLEEAV